MRVCMSAWVETATPPSNCSCTTSYRRYVMAFSQACFWRCWCHGLDWAPNCVNRSQQLIDESTFCNYIQPSYLLWQDICRRSSSSLLKCQVVGVAAESRWQIVSFSTPAESSHCLHTNAYLCEEFTWYPLIQQKSKNYLKKKKKTLNFLRRIQQFFLVGNFCPEEEKKWKSRTGGGWDNTKHTASILMCVAISSVRNVLC